MFYCKIFISPLFDESMESNYFGVRNTKGLPFGRDMVSNQRLCTGCLMESDGYKKMSLYYVQCLGSNPCCFLFWTFLPYMQCICVKSTLRLMF